MKLQLFDYKCEPAGHDFQVPELPAAAYGEFLLRDPTGMSTRYLNALADSSFDEVGKILQSLPEGAGLTARKRAEKLHQVFGAVACDSDAEGRPFRIGQHAACPVCGSTVMRSWQESNPDHFVDVDVRSVTHSKWSTLNNDQKEAAVRQALLAV